MKTLLAEHELVLIEGAGSPAETNLHDTDLANMLSAQAAAARVLLVADIDRGGAFAHLYGTWALLPEAERALLAGFVLNKFRGDPGLLSPAPEDLERLTGVPTLGVIPWLQHGLPDEDGAAAPATSLGKASVAVVRYPTASNLDEYKLLEQVVDLSWADQPRDLEHSDLVILPGSKHVAADLAWLGSTGIAEAVYRRAQTGRPVLGICGGLQMLGERIEDKAEVDGSADGLGLLPLRTTFGPSKLSERVSCCFKVLSAPWQALSGSSFSGYQIRHGLTVTTGPAAEALPHGLGYASGAVLGIYAHGMFEEPALLNVMFDEKPARSLEMAFDELADAIEEHLDVSFLVKVAGIA